MLRAVLERALGHLGRELGQELGLSEEGRAVIAVDELYDCDVVLDEAAGRVELAMPLSMVPDAQADSLYSAALQLTLGGTATRGAAIVLHPELPVLSLRLSLSAEGADDVALEQSIAAFLVAADAVRDGLARRPEARVASPAAREREVMIRG